MGEVGEGGKQRRRRVPKPLDRTSLDELALAYVARFATSRGKLSRYLQRKLRERGWAGEQEPDLPALVDRLARNGFVNDRAFAEAKTSSLLRRGYGRQRIRAQLGADGIGEEDRGTALEQAHEQAWSAAMRFAERRRIGPYATVRADQGGRAKALAAMMRAGHPLDVARRIVEAEPGVVPREE